MLKVAATATTHTGLSSTPNLIHVTETHAILDSDSSESIDHLSILKSNRTQACLSPAATLTSGSSSSQITVLPTNELDEDADVISEIRADQGGYQVLQNLIPSISRNNQHCRSNLAQPNLFQTERVVQQSQQGRPSILLLKSLSTTLWIDRALILLGVFIPLSLGVCFFFVHSFTDFASCQSIRMDSTASPSKFVNQVCRTKLLQIILQGSKDIDNEKRLTGSLQHECFPIILVIVAFLNWIPHLCWHLAVRQSIYCDASHVASGLRSFRKTAQRELLSIASMINSRPINSNFVPIIQETKLKNCTCQTPIRSRSGEEFTTAGPKGNLQLSKMETMVSTVDTGYESEMDLPSAAVMHLPKLRVSRDDNALNLFIAGWQNTDFYIRRFLAKHVILALFNIITFSFVVTFTIFTHGEPFSGSFYCRPTEKSTALHICLISTAFALNLVAFLLGALGLAGLVCFLIFFRRNFACKDVYKESTIACGTKSVLHTDLTACLVGRCNENFFSDYIRLLALARMQFRGSLFVTRREVFNIRLSYLPGLTRTDFHFINLLCKENIRHFPDAMHLQVWLLRYVFLCRNLGLRVFGRATSTSNNRLKSEDLSPRLGFRKIRIQVDICN